ncbi:MAG: hypothetical protein ACXWUF_19055 [Methylomagnum sp.]
MNIVDKWIEATKSQLRGNSLTEELEYPVIRLFELCSYKPNEAIEIIAEIIEKNPDEKILDCLGAGPIEELLIKYPSYLDILVDKVTNGSSLNRCLSHVNFDEEEPQDRRPG